MSQKARKGQGNCTECGYSFKTHASDGTVHRHGHRSTPCSGSKQLPAGGPMQPTAILSGVQTGASVVGQSSNAFTTTHLGTEDASDIEESQHRPTTGTGEVTIQHPNINKRLLKHIPKGARSESGRLLTNLINAILSDTDRIENWRNLMAFTAIVFELPNRGGKRHNLTSTIKRRMTEFHHSLPDKLLDIFNQDKSDILRPRKRPTNIERSMADAVAAKSKRTITEQRHAFYAQVMLQLR